MVDYTFPKYMIFAGENCSGNSTSVITAAVQSCTDYGAPNVILDFMAFTNMLGPPKSMILYQGSLTFGYPDYDTFKIGTCHNFSPNVLTAMTSALTGIGSTDYPTKEIGKLCNDGFTNPNVPHYIGDGNANVKMTVYEKSDCSGKSASVGLDNGDCNDFAFENGLMKYTNSTKSTTPFQSYKLDFGSNLLVYTPSNNWLYVESTNCMVVPQDVYADLQNNIKAVDFKGFKTQNHFCATSDWILNTTTATTTTTAGPTNHTSSANLMLPNLILFFLVFLFRL